MVEKINNPFINGIAMIVNSTSGSLVSEISPNNALNNFDCRNDQVMPTVGDPTPRCKEEGTDKVNSVSNVQGDPAAIKIYAVICILIILFLYGTFFYKESVPAVPDSIDTPIGDASINVKKKSDAQIGDANIKVKKKSETRIALTRDSLTSPASAQQQILSPFSLWLYDSLVEAEKNCEIRLMLDLMRIVNQQDQSVTDAILSKRHKSQKNHPWRLYQKRAEEAEKLYKYAAEIREQHSPIIHDRGDPDLDLDVYYNANDEQQTMEFVLDVTLKDIDIMSVTSLITEAEEYSKWMPGVKCITKVEPNGYPQGYYSHIQFQSPTPWVVNHRDLAMHLKIDSDFRNPDVPDEFSNRVYLRQPTDSFHMWTESMSDDPLIMHKESAKVASSYLPPPKGTPKPYKARDYCQRMFLQHGVANIQLLEENGKPSLKISMVVSVDVGLIRPLEWFLYWFGGMIFKGIFREVVKNAKEIHRANEGEATKWEYAKTFAEFIKVNALYRYMGQAIPTSLKCHKI